MKILENGKQSIECRCVGHSQLDDGCGALLLVEQGDPFVVFVDDYESKLVVVCPNCGASTDLKNPPGFLWRNAQGETAMINYQKKLAKTKS